MGYKKICFYVWSWEGELDKIMTSEKLEWNPSARDERHDYFNSCYRYDVDKVKSRKRKGLRGGIAPGCCPQICLECLWWIT